MGDVLLFVDDLQSSCTISHCRICHEAEFESRKSLESPCACSGTVKFAHRDCIQIWCDEKGSTTCEICLQNYEPGYTATSKKYPLEDAMPIRDSSEMTWREHEPEDQAEEEEATVDTHDLECASFADRSASLFRSLALIFTVLMLFKHLFATLAGGTEHYPFSLLTILVLRASGILLPMYIVFRIIATIQTSIRQRHQVNQVYRFEIERSDGEEEDRQHLV